jgi:hypothetical protein
MTTFFESIRVQGMTLAPAHIEEIRALLGDNPGLGRSHISRTICQRWNWLDELGRPRDMACRAMLVKLHERGLIQLPPRRTPGRGSLVRCGALAHDSSPIEAALAELAPIRLADARAASQTLGLFSHLLDKYHYLGFRDVGRNMKYLAFDRRGRPLACLLFGSAAWKTQPRDEFVGWDRPARHRNLQRVTNNTRFLILPWVRVPNLASLLLSLALDRLRTDWPARYGSKIVLAETFVDRSRFAGTCYRAANWICVGQTKGRSRQDLAGGASVAVKDVYLFPLEKEFRKCLTQ